MAMTLLQVSCALLNPVATAGGVCLTITSLNNEYHVAGYLCVLPDENERELRNKSNLLATYFLISGKQLAMGKVGHKIQVVQPYDS